MRLLIIDGIGITDLERAWNIVHSQQPIQFEIATGPSPAEDEPVVAESLPAEEGRAAVERLNQEPEKLSGIQPTMDELKAAIDGYLQHPNGGSVKFLALLREQFKVERVVQLTDAQKADLYACLVIA